LSRNLALIALAILMQGCQQPEPEPRNSPGPPLEQGQAAPPERDGETTEVRLSCWGVGMAPSDEPVGWCSQPAHSAGNVHAVSIWVGPDLGNDSGWAGNHIGCVDRSRYPGVKTLVLSSTRSRSALWWGC